MPQLDPTWFASQLFWLAITFAVLYFVLAKLVLPPLMGTIADRAHTLESDVSRAQALKIQAEDARTAYERALTEARAKAQQLLAEATLDQKAKADEASRRMDAEVAAKLSDAEKRIHAKKQELMDALAPTSSELAGLIVEKLTQKRTETGKLQNIIGTMFKVGRR
jgi:F-type H+-transporting ATPase subunit b